MSFDINEPLPAGVVLSPKQQQSWEPAARRYRDIEPAIEVPDTIGELPL